jgi:hypothetical protein
MQMAPVVALANGCFGHSDPRLTLNVYAQATTEADRAAAEKLGGWFMADTDVDRNGCAMNAPCEPEPADTVTPEIAADLPRRSEPERRIELLTCSLRVSCSAV